MKKTFLSIAAMAAALCANATMTWEMNNHHFNVDTIYSVTTGPGVVTTSLRLTGTDISNATTLFYSEIDLLNPNLEIHGVEAKDTGDDVETVKAMGIRKSKETGKQYVAGINGDFFNMGGSPTRTCGFAIADDVLYNPLSGTTFETYVTVSGNKDVKMYENLAAAFKLNFPSGASRSYSTNVGYRGQDMLVIFTPAFGASTGTNQWGAECAAKLVEGTLLGPDAVYEVTTAPAAVGNSDIPADGVILSGHGISAELVKSLKVGDRLSAGRSVTYDGKELDICQAIGGMSWLVKEGEIAAERYLTQPVDHFPSNQARAVVGYNEDRSKLIMLVADKHSESQFKTEDPLRSTLSPSTSSGLYIADMAYIMKHLGCYTAMAFDGGGSSTLYAQGIGAQNNVYGADDLRWVANGLFAVSNTPEDNEIASLEVVVKDVCLAEGETYTPFVYAYNKYGVIVDNSVSGYTLTVAPSLGTVDGTTFTAGSAKGKTRAVIAKDGIKCGVEITVNDGTEYITSGDDNAPLAVGISYVQDEPLGVDFPPVVEEVLYLKERYKFMNHSINDGWDGTAPDWSSADAIKAKSCPRFATGLNGKIYTVDMKTMSIAEYDSEGNLTPLYKLPSLEGREFNGVADYYGTAINHDQAGNFIVGHLFTKNESHCVWTIYDPSTGKAKHFEVEMPGEVINSRIDVIGRVIGDLTTDAYVLVTSKATGKAADQLPLVLHFTGNGDIESVEVEASTFGYLAMAGKNNTCTVAQPWFSSIEEMSGKTMNESFIWYSKGAGVGQWTCYLMTGTSSNFCATWNNYASTNGFDFFTINGKRYFVVNYVNDENVSGNTNTMNIIIKDEDGKTYGEWKNDDYTSTYGYSSITCQQIDETNAVIYVYNCTSQLTTDDPVLIQEKRAGCAAGAMIRVSNAEITSDDDFTTGIDEIVSGEESFEGAPVYYNLQGIRVANPSNGIYIVKKGNKAVKQFIR